MQAQQFNFITRSGGHTQTVAHTHTHTLHTHTHTLYTHTHTHLYTHTHTHTQEIPLMPKRSGDGVAQNWSGRKQVVRNPPNAKALVVIEAAIAVACSMCVGCLGGCVHLVSCSVDKVHEPFGVYLNVLSLSGCLAPSPSCSGKSVIVYLMPYICTQIHKCTVRK